MADAKLWENEDGWMAEVLGAVVRMAIPRGPLAAVKLRWLGETRTLLKAFRDEATLKMPAAEFAYEQRAAVIGPLETTLLDIGQKMAAAISDGEEVVAETDDGADNSGTEQRNRSETSSSGTEADIRGGKTAAAKSGQLAKQAADSTTGRKPQVCCFYCQEMHPMCKCPRFRALPGGKKMAAMLALGLCFNCYSQQHAVAKCREKNRCLRCPGRHHTNMHGVV